MLSYSPDDIESYHKELLHYFGEQITLEKIALLRKALRSVHKEVVNEESFVSTESTSRTKRYCIGRDIRNEALRTYGYSDRFRELQFGPDSDNVKILNSYSSIKDHIENKTEKVTARIDHRKENPYFPRNFSRRCIELLVFYREIYGVCAVLPSGRDTTVQDNTFHPFVKSEEVYPGDGTKVRVKVTKFDNAYREGLGQTELPVNPGPQLPPLVSLPALKSDNILYVCYYWTHLNTVGKATIRTDGWQEAGNTTFTLPRNRSRHLALKAIHLNKNAGNVTELHISVLFGDDPDKNTRQKPIYSHLTLNGSMDYLTGVYSSSRENKGLGVAGAVVCVACDEKDYEARLNADAEASIFNFLFQNRFEITESDLIHSDGKSSKPDLAAKRPSMLPADLPGRYEGHLLNISGEPTLDECTITIEPSGQAVMVLSDMVDQSEYQLYFKKHIGNKVIIGHVLTDAKEITSKEQQKITNSRAYFLLSRTKESGVLTLKGIYAGVEKNAVNTVISGRIYLQQKTTVATILKSTLLTEVEAPILAAKPLRFLLGFTDSNLTDLGLFHSNPQLLLPPTPRVAYHGDFVSCSYYEKIDEGKTSFFIEICPLRIMPDGEVLLKGESGEFRGTATLRDSELNITVLHDKSSIHIVGNVQDVKENRTPCASIWRHGHSPEARAEVLIRVTDGRLCYDKERHKKVNLKSDLFGLGRANLSYNGVVSFLRGSIDRYISLPQKTDIFFPRVSRIRRAHFFSACYLATADPIKSKVIIEDYLQRSYIHGFAVSLIYFDKLTGIDDQIVTERISRNKESIDRDHKFLKKEISDGGALVGFRKFIRELWRNAIPLELQKICDEKSVIQA